MKLNLGTDLRPAITGAKIKNFFDAAKSSQCISLPSFKKTGHKTYFEQAIGEFLLKRSMKESQTPKKISALWR